MNTLPRKYAFNWDVIGTDVQEARPALGLYTSFEVYRLLQFTLRDVLESRYGTKAADEIFREAGTLAGKAFFERYCADATDIPSLVKTIQQEFRTLGIGIVRFEKTDTKTMTFQLTVDEDLDCSGLPDTSDHICVYDEGFIKGIFDSFTGKDFTVQEVDCWCSGARTCRFKATLP
ncbi:V4R domain-containing protein [Desulfobulbus oligotrophicus]|uniref:4-vinyl reductase n=1 Tax=Desulfobulbus oligotrophicus TaxID=1909699 RepID=A0A7T6AQW9_9BACT|nr:V4R domain-containing protein [Desulfobulbus oligotrophicus]QQG66171.1 4-vinyl reductase [Desulfobulbus oligotrophicus]